MAEKQFDWIDFYTEFADKLLAFRNDRPALIEKIKAVYGQLEQRLPKLDLDGAPIDMDPFTVFGLFNKGITNANRITLLREMGKAFNVAADVPKSFDGIPVLNNLSATFYTFSGSRREHDIDNLWAVFASALNYAQTPSDEKRAAFSKAYDIVISQVGIRWNITMGLYWIRPYTFISLDSRNRWFMLNTKNMPADFVEQAEHMLVNVPDAANYLSICHEFKEAMATGKYAYKSFPELSYQAWVISEKANKDKKAAANATEKSDSSEQEWFPAEYSPLFTIEDWVKLLNDRELFEPKYLAIMKRFKDIGGMATCKQLSVKYGDSVSFYVQGSSGLAHHIAEKTGCPVPTGDTAGSKWWPILYLGRGVAKGEMDHGVYIWKLRDELSAALDQVDLSDVPLYAENYDSGTDAKTFHSEARFKKWFMPILDALIGLGGEAPRPEVQKRIIEICHITDEEIAGKNKSGNSIVLNDIDWARNYLNYEVVLCQEKAQNKVSDVIEDIIEKGRRQGCGKRGKGP